MERSTTGGDFKIRVRSEKVFDTLEDAQTYADALYKQHGTFSSMVAVDQRYLVDVRDIPVCLTEQGKVPVPQKFNG